MFLCRKLLCMSGSPESSSSKACCHSPPFSSELMTALQDIQSSWRARQKLNLQAHKAAKLARSFTELLRIPASISAACLHWPPGCRGLRALPILMVHMPSIMLHISACTGASPSQHLSSRRNWRRHCTRSCNQVELCERQGLLWPR